MRVPNDPEGGPVATEDLEHFEAFLAEHAARVAQLEGEAAAPPRAICDACGYEGEPEGRDSGGDYHVRETFDGSGEPCQYQCGPMRAAPSPLARFDAAVEVALAPIREAAETDRLKALVDAALENGDEDEVRAATRQFIDHAAALMVTSGLADMTPSEVTVAIRSARKPAPPPIEERAATGIYQTTLARAFGRASHATIGGRRWELVFVDDRAGTVRCRDQHATGHFSLANECEVVEADLFLVSARPDGDDWFEAYVHPGERGRRPEEAREAAVAPIREAVSGQPTPWDALEAADALAHGSHFVSDSVTFGNPDKPYADVVTYVPHQPRISEQQLVGQFEAGKMSLAEFKVAMGDLLPSQPSGADSEADWIFAAEEEQELRRQDSAAEMLASLRASIELRGAELAPDHLRREERSLGSLGERVRRRSGAALFALMLASMLALWPAVALGQPSEEVLDAIGARHRATEKQADLQVNIEPYQRPRWAITACRSTRTEVLIATCAPVALNARGCAVVQANCPDIYSGAEIATDSPASALQIDHLLPLRIAWERRCWVGADFWRFANDKRDNLVVTRTRTNQRKGGRMPDRWCPANAPSRPMLAIRFRRVAQRYGIRLTDSELSGLRDWDNRQCAPGAVVLGGAR